jgi:hypothetical protein
MSDSSSAVNTLVIEPTTMPVGLPLRIDPSHQHAVNLGVRRKRRRHRRLRNGRRGYEQHGQRAESQERSRTRDDAALHHRLVDPSIADAGTSGR